MARVLTFFFRCHLWLGLLLVAGVTLVLSARVTDRTGFADSALKRDVMERWGAPIEQPSPSVRYVRSGAVFSELKPLGLDRQEIDLDAAMNYRKRGLVYFSGFDFSLRAAYEVHNPEAAPIEVAFVLPISARRNQVLLSDLSFTVGGKPARAALAEEGDKLVWTGRLEPGEKVRFEIGFRGRGLDSFVYALDPALPVSQFRFTARVSGGANYDYPSSVVPAPEVQREGDRVALTWRFGSLESGVPVGLILPSEQSYDRVIALSAQRSFAPFVLFFLAVALLFGARGRSLRPLDAVLLSASYALFFPLLGYLAAAMPFAGALVLAAVTSLGLLALQVNLALGREAARWTLLAALAFLLVPVLAVLLDGYTGLIYTLEATGLAATLILLGARPDFRDRFEELLGPAPRAPSAPIPAPAAPLASGETHAS